MPNANDVVNGLERCLVVGCDDCNQPDKSGCPWDCEGFDRMVNEAVVMLKAQEPKLVHVTADINHRKIGECPTCGKWINSGDYPNYCGHCGQVVRWG